MYFECNSQKLLCVFLVLRWIMFCESIYGKVEEVCVNNASTSISFYLPSLQLFQNISFPQSINYVVTSIDYTYDDNTWYSKDTVTNVLDVISLNIFALGVKLALVPTGNSTVGCFNTTLHYSDDLLSPDLTFNTTDDVLVDKKEVVLYVTGQQPSKPSCILLNSKYLNLSLVSTSLQDTQTVFEYKAVVSIDEHKKELCNFCTKQQCVVTLICSTNYPGSELYNSANISLQARITASQLNVSLVTSNSSHLQLAGDVLQNGCPPTTAMVEFKSNIWYFEINELYFLFTFFVGKCTMGKLSVKTLTSTNLTGDDVNVGFQTQPDFNITVTLSNNKMALTVSWEGTTCLENYSYVELFYTVNKDWKSENVSTNLSMTVIPAEANSYYKIWIRLLSNSTISDDSKTMTVNTPPLVPGPLLTASLQKTFNISWQYPAVDNITFNVVVTTLRLYDAMYSSKTYLYITNKTYLVDRNLIIEPATEYKIEISACNGMLNSSKFEKSVLSPSYVKNGPALQKPTLVTTTRTTAQIQFSQPDVNGPITFYDIIVTLSGDVNLTEGFECYNFSTARMKNLSSYISLRYSKPVLKSVSVWIGDNTTTSYFYNAPLTAGTQYTIYLRLASSWDNQLHFTPLNNENGLVLTTSSTPVPEKEKSISISSGAKIAIIVSSILIVFILFFCWVFFQVRKHRQKESTETSFKDYSTTVPRKQSASPGQVNLAYELESVNQNVIGLSPLKYDIDDVIKPVKVSDFPKYIVDIKNSFDIQRQFQKLKDGHEFECKSGTDPVNVSRNRYEDIKPYDHNRFILEVDRKISDYINASIVGNYIKKDAYIATQGPLPSTFNDFWKMVWQTEATTIVMLGQRIENGIIKYALYWPTATDVEMKYGRIMAKMKCYDKHSGYTTTTISLYKKSQPQIRTVKLFHFSAWPDQEAPNKIQDFLIFRNAVHNWQRDSKSPVIVHCSAGVGRTGAFISIDAIIENLSRVQTIDIFNYVNYLRTCRMYMVQTQEQYQFIHDALLEHILGQSSEVDITKQNVERVVKELTAFDVKTNMDGFTKYFQKLNRLSSKPQFPEDCEGFKEVHSQKNRYSRLLPYNKWRYQLSVVGLTVNDTYVNATRINKRLITTQAPLEATCKDFWLMAYETDTKNVVMLNNRQEGTEIFSDYFSVAETTTHGPLSVAVISELSVMDDVIKREMMLKHKDATNDEQIITHYHVKNWPTDSVPDSVNSIVYIVNELLRSNASEPTIIHCNDGFNRSGCLAACLLCVEKINKLDHVTVDDVITMLRERHQSFINTIEEYEFIYHFLKEFLIERYSGVTYI